MKNPLHTAPKIWCPLQGEAVAHGDLQVVHHVTLQARRNPMVGEGMVNMWLILLTILRNI